MTNNILDQLDMAADLENADTARMVLAQAVGGYFTELVKSGVPHGIAGLLTQDYQQFLFVTGMREESDD